MDIKQQTIRVRDLIAGYQNDPDHGVRGYGGRLDIRPPYQREFRYDTKQKQAVVNTILRGFPLNIMYWSVVGGRPHHAVGRGWHDDCRELPDALQGVQQEERGKVKFWQRREMQ